MTKAVWLENQFSDEPDPTPDTLSIAVTMQQIGKTAQQIVSSYGIAVHTAAESVAKAWNAQQNTVLKHDPKTPTRPPHSMTPTRVFDRRGRKLY